MSHRLHWILSALICTSAISGPSQSADTNKRWPTASLAFPLDEWKQIDTTGKETPVENYPALKGWIDSTDRQGLKTRITRDKDGVDLVYWAGSHVSRSKEDRFLISRKVAGTDATTKGFVDADGNVVIQPTYYDAGEFKNGLAFVMEKEKSPWKIIDKNGEVKFTIPANIDVGQVPVVLENKIVRAEKKDAKSTNSNTVSGLFDLEQQVFYPVAKAATISEPTEGLWQYRLVTTGKSGFVNSKGRVVIPAQFSFTTGFHEGLAAVLKNNRWSYIDKTGKTVIQLPANFSQAEPFSEGLAAVAVGGDAKEPDFLRVRKGAKWGFIDKTGKVIIPAKYFIDNNPDLPNNAPQFGDGLAHVAEGGGWSHLYGFIDTHGKWKIEPKYKDAWDFHDGHAMVCIGHIGFNQNKWNSKDGIYTNRAGEFNLFLRQFDIIGMPRTFLINALGKPDQTDGNDDFYSLGGGMCINTVLDVQIRSENGHVTKFKFLRFRKSTNWITKVAPDTDILNLPFAPTVKTKRN